MITIIIIIIFRIRLPQALDGCWCLLCQGLGYFLQPRSLNVLPDLTI